jgi:membrane-bound serine protease (ClpP class)
VNARSQRWSAWAYAGLALLLCGHLVAGPPEASRGGALLHIRGPIGPAVSDFFVRELRKADDEDATLVVVTIDTPGGLDTSMRDMIQAILAADVPVVFFVSPSGARAASAGTYLLYASHVAAMAPGTNLGAATPIAIGGGGGAKPPPPTPSPSTPAEQPSSPATSPVRLRTPVGAGRSGRAQGRQRRSGLLAQPRRAPRP